MKLLKILTAAIVAVTMIATFSLSAANAASTYKISCKNNAYGMHLGSDYTQVAYAYAALDRTTRTGAGGVGIGKDLYVGEDLTVSGNLLITGTTTSINTTNMSITDSLIGLSSGTSNVPSNDSGFIIERGSSANVFMGWDEANDKFVMGTTTATDLSSGALTMIA